VIVGGGGSSTNPSLSNDSFAGLFLDAAVSNRASAQQRMPTAGTLSQFSFRVSGAPGAAKSWIVTVERNGEPTALGCEIAGASTLVCSDLVDSASFAAGDLISIQINPEGSPNSASPARWTGLFTAE
jgi:hypothetical protein